MGQLGSIRRIDARDVWQHEAQQFTPWLRENITLLGSALGLDLDLVQSEVPVGPFAADLVAKEVSNDRWVVIENQLTPTDHAHLGQLLTYGAGTEARVFVWISPEFREEHRAALDWLNEHSDEDSLFFGVQIELLAVDDSRPAPNFRMVSFPNEWQKATRATRQPITEKGVAYAEFFGKVLANFRELYPGETNVTKPARENWQPMSIGRSGFLTVWSFTAQGRFRVELSIDTGDLEVNKAYFEQLRQGRRDIELAIGHAPLEWDEMEGRRVRRVYSYYPQPVTVLDDQEVSLELHNWAVEEMKRFRDAFRPKIQGLDVFAPAVHSRE